MKHCAAFALHCHWLCLCAAVLACIAIVPPVPMVAQDLERIGEGSAINAHGSVAVRTVGYAATGINARRNPLSWTLSGTVTANVYDLALPFSFVIGEQERSYSQPFNRFGISPKYKWATAHLGYRSLSFSPYTLSGHQFLGAGLELNPGKFRLGMMYGNLQRAVEEDTATASVTPAYERTGFGGRIGYGTDSEYLDIIVFKGQDNANSLSRVPSSGSVLPGENLVVGLSGRAEIVQGVTAYFDGAVSDYTRDSRVQTIASTNELTDALQDIIPPRISTQLYTAFRAGATLSLSHFGLNASFSRIDPDYQSMGAYAMNTDMQSIVVAPSLMLPSAGVRVQASFTVQHDNLQNKKAATTQRILPMVAVSYTPTPALGLDVQYTDVLTTQRAGLRPLNDTVVVQQRVPMMSISPRYSIADSALSHTVFANVTYQTLADDNPFTRQYAQYSTLGVHASYSISFVPSALSLSLSANTTTMNNASGNTRNSGFALGATKSFWENSLSSSANMALSLYPNGSTVSGSLGSRYAVTKEHSISVELSYVSSSASAVENTTFSEFTAMASYVFTF